MFDTTIDEMREQISYSPKDFWVKQEISPAMLLEYKDQVLESLWYELDHQAAQKIFKLINDGELYCIHVKRFERNLDFPAKDTLDTLVRSGFRGDPNWVFPEISIGYRGSLSKVRVEPWVARNEPWLKGIRPPSWAGLRRDIWRLLKNDFKPNNLIRWIVKNVLARALYLPDENPSHWGVGKF